MYKNIITTLCVLGVITGCGSSGSTTKDEVVGYKGFLVDAPIKNVDWSCGTKSGKTLADGAFGICPKNTTVTFSIGNLIIGKAVEAPKDRIVTVQEMLGLDREDTENETVIALSALLLSMDEDGDPSNGITITDKSVEGLNEAIPKERVFSLIPKEETQSITEGVVKRNPQVSKVPTADEIKQHLQDTNGDIADGTQPAGEDIKEITTS